MVVLANRGILWINHDFKMAIMHDMYVLSTISSQVLTGISI